MGNIDKYHNQQFTTLESENVPARTGDRRYSQDRVRDFWYMMERVGFSIRDLFETFPVLIDGGAVTQGAGASLDITAGFGYASFEVDIPNSFASLPPTVTQADVEAIRIYWAAQNDINASSANCSVYSITDDGATTHYVKMRYKETDGNTRNRAKLSGSYAYEVTPDFDLQVDAVAPTDYDIVLDTFTSSGGTYTFAGESASKPIQFPLTFDEAFRGSKAIGEVYFIDTALYSRSLYAWEQLCDGSEITDSNSPMNGKRTRNLNGGNVVLTLTWTADGAGAYATAASDDVSALNVGDGVSGTGIASGSEVTDISGTTVTISDTAATGSISSTFTNDGRFVRGSDTSGESKAHATEYHVHASGVRTRNDIAQDRNAYINEGYVPARGTDTTDVAGTSGSIAACRSGFTSEAIIAGDTVTENNDSFDNSHDPTNGPKTDSKADEETRPSYTSLIAVMRIY